MKLLVVDAPQPCRTCLAEARLGPNVTTIGPLQENLADAITWLGETAALRRTVVLHARSRDTRFGAAFDRLVESAGSTPIVLVPAAGSAHGVNTSAYSAAPCLTCRSLIQGSLAHVTEEIANGHGLGTGALANGEPGAGGSGEGDDDRTLLARLSRRQRDVLGLLGQGYSNKEIARILGISYITVRVHVSAVMRSLEVANRTQAALIAAGAGDLVDTSRRRAVRARSAA